MPLSTIKELQHKIVEMRQRLHCFLKQPGSVGLEKTSAARTIMQAAHELEFINEINLHVRALALHCISLSRRSGNPKVARGLEEFSVLLVDAVSRLEAAENE
jgi:hypothetical protein